MNAAAEVSFERIARLGEALEQTGSRLEKARLIAELLRSLAPEEVAPAVRLTIGQVFAPSDPRVLNVSSSAVWRAIEPVAQAAGPEALARVRAEARDFGDTVRGIWEAAGRGRGEAPPLTLCEVYRAFEAIAADTGPGSRTRRDERIAALLARAEPKIVVEVAFNNVQRSPRYPSGLALRFARIVGFRPDKTPADADTLESIRRLQQ